MNTKINIDLEQYFATFRNKTIGGNQKINTPYGKKELLYADWIASGRLYGPIEDRISNVLGPMYANTHSNSSETGKVTTLTYRFARDIIKAHVNALESDLLITVGAGTTSAISRLIRILKLKKDQIPDFDEKPIVFISHLEHHSNHVAWLETHADVVVLGPGSGYLPCPEQLISLLEENKERKLIIGAFSACSNVTGIITNYKELAKIIHGYNGFCFVDFAASAPYVPIDMHPEVPGEHLDAIYFSPHKFLGGPGSSGILVVTKELYLNSAPECPGGGNVKWTDPWGRFEYFDDLEVREDGGTPGIIQTIKSALAIRLKERMDPDLMKIRDQQSITYFTERLETIKEVSMYGDRSLSRIGCVAFNVEGIHYNLVVRLLNDRFGIQVRGGWSCASTQAHYLFSVDKEHSRKIMDNLNSGNLSDKPGWVRVSIHPIMTIEELDKIVHAIREVVLNIHEWSIDYSYNHTTNDFEFNHQWCPSWDERIFFTIN